MIDTQQRYSSVAIALHWVMAALILFMIWLGHNMENQEARFQLHKSIGITLLVLTIARIVWRLYNKPPALPADFRPFEARLSKLVQLGFYALMLLIPLGGWVMVSVSPFAVPTVLFETISWPKLPLGRDETAYKFLANMHGKAGTFGFLALLFLHVAGAVKHEIGHEEGMLKRILPSRSRGAQAGRGMGATLFASLGFFGAIAAIPILTKLTLAVASEMAAAPLKPNWTVLKEGKSITFDFSHDGANYTGRFGVWDAQIEFYEDNLPASKVLVDVDLTSAITGKKLYDDSLKSAEWFDIKTSSRATVRLDDFERAGEANSYRAKATLALKGIEVTVPFAFKLSIEDGRAQVQGTTTLTRKALILGQDSDPGADWVGENVTVNVSLDAIRND